MYDRKAAGTLIQNKRLEARLTQEALAERAGCSVRHIVNLERGAVGMSIEIMLKICRIFHWTPNDLLLSQGAEATAEIHWLISSLKAMNPDQRQTAISIVSPYIETVLHG